MEEQAPSSPWSAVSAGKGQASAAWARPELDRLSSLPPRAGKRTYASPWRRHLVQLLSRVRLCGPVDCSTPGFPVLHHLLEFLSCPLSDTIPPSHRHPHRCHLCWGSNLLMVPSVKVLLEEATRGPVEFPKAWSVVSWVPLAKFTASPSSRQQKRWLMLERLAGTRLGPPCLPAPTLKAAVSLPFCFQSGVNARQLFPFKTGMFHFNRNPSTSIKIAFHI